METQPDTIGTPEETETLIRAAKEYLKLGYRPIPLVPGTKQAAVPWKEWQTNRPTEDWIDEQFRRPRCNLALVMGMGVVVVDVDDPALLQAVLEHCGETPMRCRTPRGGFHLYYGMRKGVTYGNAVKINGRPVDLRGEQAYVVSPWSRNEDGVPYEWLGPVLPVKELPRLKVSWLREKTPRRTVKAIEVPSADISQLIRRARAYMAHVEGAVAGQRGHDKLYRTCFILLEKFPLPQEIAWQLLHEYNATCEPPFSIKELTHKFEDALRELTRRGKR